MFLKRRRIASMGIVIAVMFLLFTTILAQGNETILTIAVQEWQQDVYGDELFADFEAANPGVKVVVETMGQDDNFYNSALFDMDGFMERGSNFASKADVLPISSYQMSPEATRAGFFLDMSPLLAGDATLDTADFYESMLQSFQWDGGTWALPVAGRVNILIYDRNAFDEANLAYPDESWGISDFLDAGRALTTYKDNGDVERSALIGFDNRLLFRILLEQSLYDNSVIPEVPALVNQDLATLLETWKAYQLEIFGESGPDFNTVDFNNMPLNISGVWQLDNNAFGNESDADYAGTLLPGGVAGLDVEGFAISAGTDQPMLAYELIKYLTTNAEVVTRTFADSPARRSMVGVESDEDNVFFGPERSEETQALIDRALENALPASELRYFDAVTSLASPGNNPENPRPD
ncbi:MAG: ABC transporter substrate-binding protein, partial [Aggregatilineales bacterium]